MHYLLKTLPQSKEMIEMEISKIMAKLAKKVFNHTFLLPFHVTFWKKSGTLRQKLSYTFIRRGKNKKKWHNGAPDKVYILRQQDLK